MAKNIRFETADSLSVVVTDPASPVSGDPVLFGDLPGLALTDKGKGGNPAAKTTVKFRGAADIPVKGVNAGGNSAVAEGDVLYYVAADTPKVSKKNTGVRYGVAMGAVTGGATTTIPVRIGY